MWENKHNTWPFKALVFKTLQQSRATIIKVLRVCSTTFSAINFQHFSDFGFWAIWFPKGEGFGFHKGKGLASQRGRAWFPKGEGFSFPKGRVWFPKGEGCPVRGTEGNTQVVIVPHCQILLYTIVKNDYMRHN